MKRRAFIYTWSTEDEETEVHSRFHIRMYGLDEEGRNVCLHVDDFRPYFYVELRGVEEMEVKKFEVGICKNLLALMSRHEIKDCRKGGDCPYCWKGEMKIVSGLKKLYFHHERNSFSMIQVFFPNNLQRKRAYYKLQEKSIQVGFRTGKTLVLLHENEANPILQFCTQQKIDSCGWIQWKKSSSEKSVVPDKQSLCHREVFKSAKEICPLGEEVGEMSPPAPYTMSCDIEVYSSVASRMPDPEVEADVIFQVSAVFARAGNDSTRKQYLLTLGKPIQSMVGKDVVIRSFESERDLLMGFTALIREENPNLIIGYNIFGFDLMYMIARAKMWNIMDGFDQMGMRYRDARGRACHAPEKQISWSSSAYSCQSFFFLDAEGRLFIDLLPVIRRDYKFENYRLKTVSEFFIGDTKDPITPRDIFESYRIAMLASPDNKKRFHLLSRVGKYCVQDSALVLRLFDKLQLWIGLCEMAKTCRVPILTLYTQGQQIKVFSQLYFSCTYDRIVVQSPHSLAEDKKQIEGADHYSGAMVFTPDPGIYDWVIPFDFTSLYPTTIIAYNIDFSTLVIDDSVPDEKCHVVEWWDHIGCVHDKTVHATKIKTPVCQQFRYRFLREPMGVIPRLLQALLKQRKVTKGLMKAVDKKIEAAVTEEEKTGLKMLYNVYDKRQLAYKVSANSMYGAMGVKKGYLPFLPGAMCTTAMGRCSIQKAADYVKKQFQGKIIYGDTDSIYCHFPLADQPDFARKLWDHAKWIEKDLLKIFPDPMKLVFEEKIYKKFLILTKKRYMALTCDHTGENEDKLTIRGVLLARRDNARWVRQLYEMTVRSIMADATLPDIRQKIEEALLEIFRSTSSIPLKQFIISKTLAKDYAVRAPPTEEKKLMKRLEELGIQRGEETEWREQYESRSRPAHAQLAEKMKKRGCVVEPGSRIEFIIVQHPSKDAKLFERIEDPTYYRDHSDMVKIDPLYYAQNLVNPMDQILEVCFKEKSLVKRVTDIHECFRRLMDELMWQHHPYVFQANGGEMVLHPDATRFERVKKRAVNKKKKEMKIKAAAEMGVSTKTKKPSRISKEKTKLMVDMAKDLLSSM